MLRAKSIFLLVIPFLLFSCGLGNRNFNKQKYTSLKKINSTGEISIEQETSNSRTEWFDELTEQDEQSFPEKNNNSNIESKKNFLENEIEETSSVNPNDNYELVVDDYRPLIDNTKTKTNSKTNKKDGNGWWITLYTMLMLAGVGFILLGIYFVIYGGLSSIALVSLALGGAMLISSIILFARLSNKPKKTKSGNGWRVFLYVILIIGAIVSLLIGGWITAWAGGVEFAGISLLLLGIALLILVGLLIKNHPSKGTHKKNKVKKKGRTFLNIMLLSFGTTGVLFGLWVLLFPSVLWLGFISLILGAAMLVAVYYSIKNSNTTKEDTNNGWVIFSGLAIAVLILIGLLIFA
jgi:hypothetical protein